MRLCIYSPLFVSKAEFVNFWAQQYDYPHEDLYSKSIGKPPTEPRVMNLFRWKNGSPLSKRKEWSIRSHFVARIREAKALPKDTDPATFLATFRHGGAIHRIFWLHCWQPKRFPIFDQHVYRAMVYIESGRLEEIPQNERTKIDLYLGNYLPFYRSFSPLDDRMVDKALWVYGKFLKSTQFPDARTKSAI